MNGKVKCAALKRIRRDIANANDLDLVIPECTHKGDCPGTCPRCEYELRYLEKKLEERRRNGFRVVLAGISAGFIAAGAVSCAPDTVNTGDTDITAAADTNFIIPSLDGFTHHVEMGSIAYVPETADTDDTAVTDTSARSEETYAIAGFIQEAPDSYDESLPEEAYRLEGDIAFLPEDSDSTPEE